VKFEPVRVTDVPPAVGPLFGLTLVRVGSGAYVNWSAELVELLPPGAVTVISIVPDPAGAIAAISVDEATKNPSALRLVLPNATPKAPEKFVPVMVTVVPPEVGPLCGLTAVTVGAPKYVY